MTRDLIPGTKLARKVAMEERRTAQRYKISAAVVVRCQSTAMASEFIHAETHDVSTRGIFFTSNQRFAVGTRVGLSLTIPLQATDRSQLVVDAKAKVMRVEENPDNAIGRVGIAAVIDTYDIVQPKSAA
jgi:hypothetical protein